MKNENKKEIFTREFKLKFFGYGDWLDEPDSVAFEYRGFLCLVLRICKREIYAAEEAYFGGHLCGYLMLPPDSPLYGKTISEMDLDCHGGLTCAEETEAGYMIGFDCAHSTDIIPSSVELRKKYPLPDIYSIPEEFKHLALFSPTYKNMSFCIKECKKLAKQVINLCKVLS